MIELKSENKNDMIARKLMNRSITKAFKENVSEKERQILTPKICEKNPKVDISKKEHIAFFKDNNGNLSNQKNQPLNMIHNRNISNMGKNTFPKNIRDFSYPRKAETMKSPSKVIYTNLKENKDINSENLILSYKNKMIGLFFKDKIRDFKKEKIHHVENLNETGTNNMGIILDLDDVVALTKIGSAESAQHAALKANPSPSGAYGWISATLGGYLTIAGMYFGFDNYRKATKTIKSLQPVIEKINQNIKKLENSKDVTPQEIKNMKVYSATTENAVVDSKFQKWVSGVNAFAGAATLFGSLIMSTLAIPGLAFMCLFSIGNIARNAYDYRKTLKVDLQKTEEINTEFGKKGKESFIERLKTKSAHFKKMIPAWATFGVGSGIVLASLAVGVATSVVFPLPVMIVSAAFIAGSVITIIRNTTKNHSKITPKNENRIARQNLGNEENILWKIGHNNDRIDAIKTFRDNIDKNLRTFYPSKRFEIISKRVGEAFLNLLTLGIPRQVQMIDEKIRKCYFKYQEHPQLEDKTRIARYEYFSKSLTDQSKYLDFVKKNIDLLDLSILKHATHNSRIDTMNIEKSTSFFQNNLEKQIEKNNALKLKMDNQINIKNDSLDFCNVWDYMQNYQMATSVFEKVYDSIRDKNNFQKFEISGFIKVEQAPNGEGTQVTFNKEEFITSLNHKDPVAKELLNVIYRKLDITIADELYMIFKYKNDELCDHLEQRLRKV